MIIKFIRLTLINSIEIQIKRMTLIQQKMFIIVKSLTIYSLDPSPNKH